MATKMTAVQWLEIAVQNKLASEMGPFFQEAFELAKKLEKDQINDAYWDGICNWDETKNSYYWEQYYVKTFES
jgi:hypothetical protein